MSLNAANINAIFEAILQRPASAAEQATWVATDASIGDAAVIADIATSGEAQAEVWPIIRLLYLTSGGIFPTAAEIANNVAKQASDGQGGTASFLQITENLLGTAAFQTAYGFTGNHTLKDSSAADVAFVKHVYEIAASYVPSNAQVKDDIKEFKTVAGLIDAVTLKSPAFLATLDPQIITFLETQADTAAGIPPTGQVFTLTIGVDAGSAFTATTPNAVFNAPDVGTVLGVSFPGNTLNAGDSLTDKVGDGTLNATVSGALVAAAVNPVYAVGVGMNGIATVNYSYFAAVAAPVPAGFQGTILGLKTFNDNNSNGPVEAGFTAAGIDATGAVLSALNINGNAQAAGSNLAFIYLAAANGALANTLTIGLNSSLGSAAALQDLIWVSTDSSTAGTLGAPQLSYGTFVLNAATGTSSFIEMGAGTGAGGTGAIAPGSPGAPFGVDGATEFKITGAGNLTLSSAAVAGLTCYQLVTTIDASASTGNVYITGTENALAGEHGVTLNAGTTGFLNGDFALNDYLGSKGTNILDVSDDPAALLAGLKANVTASTATNNDIDVSDNAATTTSASTFAGISGFQILGVSAPAGTINYALLPTSINDILYDSPAGAAGVTILNAPETATGLTVDTENNGGGFLLKVSTAATAVFGVTSTTSTGSLTVIDGSAAAAGGKIGISTMFGEDTLTIVSQGPGGVAADNTMGSPFLVPEVGGSESVTITGSHGFTFGGPDGTVIDFNPITFGLNPFNMTITDSNTAQVTFQGAAAGPIDFAPSAGATVIGYSVNANIINVTAGALDMKAGDANFVAGATVAASVGDSITGGPGVTTGNPALIGTGNVLIGSTGNDSITSKAAPGVADTAVTDGGIDVITLVAGHTASDNVEFYSADSGVGAFEVAPAPGIAGTVTPIADSITSTVGLAQPGWWGLGAGAVPAFVGGLLAGTGTSADQSTVTNFLTGSAIKPQDSADFAGGAWGKNPTTFGLSDDGLTDPIPTHGFRVAAVVAVVALGSATPLTKATDFIEVTSQFISNANQLAGLLSAAPTSLNFTVGAASFKVGNVTDILVAYQDIGGTTHIADVNLLDATAEASGATYNTAADGTVTASDIVALSGVAITNLHAGNIHFV